MVPQRCVLAGMTAWAFSSSNEGQKVPYLKGLLSDSSKDLFLESFVESTEDAKETTEFTEEGIAGRDHRTSRARFPTGADSKQVVSKSHTHTQKTDTKIHMYTYTEVHTYTDAKTHRCVVS